MCICYATLVWIFFLCIFYLKKKHILKVKFIKKNVFFTPSRYDEFFRAEFNFSRFGVRSRPIAIMIRPDDRYCITAGSGFHGQLDPIWLR